MSGPGTRSGWLIAASFVVLFPGGAAVGDLLARTLAPGSFVAEAVSFFALPVAFAMALQAWYGFAIVSVAATLWRMLVRRAKGAAGRAFAPRRHLPGAFVFLPFSVGASAFAGAVAGLLSPTRPALLVFLVYLAGGLLHGLAAWRLARAGYLMPPEAA